MAKKTLSEYDIAFLNILKIIGAILLYAVLIVLFLYSIKYAIDNSHDNGILIGIAGIIISVLLAAYQIILSNKANKLYLDQQRSILNQFDGIFFYK